MSSAGYWTAEDKIPIGQTKVAIPSENGLSYGGGQKIDITIGREVQFFQPKESYLKCDVKISLPSENDQLDYLLMNILEVKFSSKIYEYTLRMVFY